MEVISFNSTPSLNIISDSDIEDTGKSFLLDEHIDICHAPEGRHEPQHYEFDRESAYNVVNQNIEYDDPKGETP